jgi:hypothetical protein
MRARPTVLAALVITMLAGHAAADVDDDCVAASTAATSLQTHGKLVEARSTILKCAALACPAQVRDLCNKRADQLLSAIPTIVFDVKDEGGNDLVDVAVTIDGAPVSQSITAAFSANPGAHKFTFQVPGKASAERTFVLHESEKGRRETISMGAKTVETKLPDTSVRETQAPVVVVETTTTPTPQPEGAGNGQRIAGGAIAGVGIASAIVGAVFAGMYVSNHGTFNQDMCAVSGANTSCPGLASNDQTYSTVAWVSAAAGGALLITGLVVFFTAPKGASKTGLTIAPSVGRLNGLFLKGQF